jgi:hypothetical protein
MSSLTLYSAEKTSKTEEGLSQKAQNLSIEKENSLPKYGIVPGSLRVTKEGFCFKYGKVELEEKDWYDGKKERKEFSSYTIVILNSGYVAIEKTNVSMEEEMERFVETHFLKESALQEIENPRSILREVEKHSDRLHAMYSKPESEDAPEKQKASDKRGLQGTEYYEEMIPEPLYKVKVKLSSVDKMKIGLDDEGTLTLHGRDLEIQTELHTINSVVDEMRDIDEKRSWQSRLTAIN